jgi:hypothetical protein
MTAKNPEAVGGRGLVRRNVARIEPFDAVELPVGRLFLAKLPRVE